MLTIGIILAWLLLLCDVILMPKGNVSTPTVALYTAIRSLPLIMITAGSMG